MIKLETCPIDLTMNRTSLGKKWTLSILRLLILGFSKFSDFLNHNPGLSSKVLSQRLREMIDEGLIEKNIINDNPVEIKYKLTPKGCDLNRVLYELSRFGSKYYPAKVFGKDNYQEINEDEIINFFGRGFKLPEDEISFDKKPVVEIL